MLSAKMRMYKDLEPHGVAELLKREYGDALVPAEVTHCIGMGHGVGFGVWRWGWCGVWVELGFWAPGLYYIY